jgi:23S rRNA (cytosine1962-C5)-methyltransferase
LTAGAALRRDLFAELLADLLKTRIDLTTVYERSDVDVRAREGLSEQAGTVLGPPPAPSLTIQEHGLTFLVDVTQGHKTGFYLDQRDNRQRYRRMLRQRAEVVGAPTVLNVFSYTGGFAVYGLSAGAATITNVDTSMDALNTGQENLRLNGMDPAMSQDLNGDAFQVLRDLRDEGRQFDVVVLDPPKFAFTQRDVKRASRGYKDINMQAIHLLKPGGLLFTFSCSGAISEDLFQKIVFGAALDTGRDVQMIGRMMQATDHPVALTFPEGAYLKGLICRTAL